MAIRIIKDYRKLRSQGATKTEAANNTWTGKVVGEYGYQVRREKDVKEIGKEDVEIVMAHFKVESISLQQSLLRGLKGLLRR
jgi:hypothetical protein